MQSTYNVIANSTIAANQAALIQAGMTMLDKHTGGVVSQGPASADVTSALTNLVTTLAADSTNTSKIAFMSVCIAANTVGTTLLGF